MSDRNLRIRVLMEGADRLTRPMRDAAAGSTRLAQSLRATRDQLKGLQRAQADIGQFRELRSGTRDLERRMAEAQARTTQLGRAIAQTNNPTKAMRREFEQARRESERLNNEHRQQSTRLQELRGRLSAAGVSTRDLVAGERRLRDQIRQTSESLREQDRRLQEVTERSRRFADARSRFSSVQSTATGLAAGGAAAIGTGITIARPLEGAAEEAMQFESSMTDINQKVAQARDAGRSMGLEMRKAALTVNQMPADLQKGVDTLTGFGLGARDAVNMMTPIGRAATAYKAEIDDLGKATFAAHDNLKVGIDQTGKSLDVMAAAGKRGAFEVKDMAQYFPALTASMQSLGGKGVPAVADLAAALQITRKGAGDASSAANNLQNLLSKINAEDTTKNFAQFGIDLPKAMKKAAAESRSPIEEIVRLTQQATGGDQSKLASLFGDMQVQQALRPLMSAFAEYQSIRSEALAANGTVNTDFADRMNDTAEKVKHAKIQAKDLAITVGNQLLPVIASGSEFVSRWGSRLAAVAQRHPQLTRAVAVGTAAFAALFLVLGAGAIVLAGIVAPIAVLSAAATALGIGMLPLIGIVAGVVAAVALLAAGAYLIYANWGAISGWFGALWETIKAKCSNALSVIIQGFLNFTPLGLLLRAFTPALSYLRSLDFATIGRNLIQGLINGVTGMLGALKSTIVSTASSVANWFKEKLGIHSPSRVFMGLGGYVMAGLDQGLAQNASGPLSRITELSGQMTRALVAGTGVGAIAAASPAAAQPAGPPGAGSAGAGNHYSISIKVEGGAAAQDIADAVRKAIEQIERDSRGRAFDDGSG
ncbi:phage tail tape measure protein, TP901 family, core region [Novosphingobium sp. Rr 2-17]|uniref:phage tail tape measure protein n=1 Tax=Novosphingobium sp. Rr 2-17 TaxID=555793 RepID=UPI00026988E9|nr:phage tail tape measure protein [Novosphingobium sp. Rr 2-17]EIZ77782.1 phage tail tape measure protein, TP901 family, core region [Novosphingobium sp. Rr 2-17]